MDDAGTPLQGVSIEFAAKVSRSYPKSDSEGRFQFATTADSVIFRRAGFMSQRVRLSDVAEPLSVVLRRSPSASMVFCKDSQSCIHNLTLDSALCFPNVPGIDVGPLQPGIDSVGRDFLSNGQRVHVESGFAGSDNLTRDSRLWDSSEFSENVYLIHQKPWLRERRAIDARGKTPDGKYWRYLQAPHESVRYSGVDRAIADRFDKLFDGVCERMTKDQRAGFVR